MHDCNRVHISLIILVVFTDRDCDFDNEFNDHLLFEVITLSFDHSSFILISVFVSILFDEIQLMKEVHSHVKKFESAFFFRVSERVTIEAFSEEFIF
jgi:hypothetical protein